MTGSSAQMPSLAFLKVLNDALASVGSDEIHYRVPNLLPSVASLAPLLQNDFRQVPQRQRSEAQAATQKLKTMTSTLLQAKSITSRWAAVCLVDALTEHGGRAILADCGVVWMRSMVALLARPEPTATLRQLIITCTRIILRSHPYPELVKDVTTPILPAFVNVLKELITTRRKQMINECLSESELVPVVLSAMNLLIPLHANIFHSIRNKLFPLLDTYIQDVEIQRLAKRLIVKISHNPASREERSLKTVVEKIQRSLSTLFCPLIESEEYPGQISEKRGIDSIEIFSGYSQDELMMDLQNDLTYLAEYIASPMPSKMNIDLGAILSIVRRCFAVLIQPEDGKRKLMGSAISRGESFKEVTNQLYYILPTVHLSAVRILELLLQRFGQLMAPFASTILHDIVAVILSTSWQEDLKLACYQVLPPILRLHAVTPLSNPPRATWDTIRIICADCLPKPAPISGIESTLTTNGHGPSQPIVTDKLQVDGSRRHARDTHFTPVLTDESRIRKAAAKVLAPLLQFIPPRRLPLAVRTEVERTAILIRDREAMIAAVTHPVPAIGGQKGRPTILPHLAREFGDDMLVDALMKPRMPIPGQGVEIGEEMEEDEEPEAEDDVIPGTDDRNREQRNGSRQQSHEQEAVLLTSPKSMQEEEVDRHLQEARAAVVQPPAPDSANERSGEQALKRHFGQAFPEDTASGERPSPPPSAITADDLEAAADKKQPPSWLQGKRQKTVVVPRESLSTGLSGNYESDSDDSVPPINLEPDTDEAEVSDEEEEQVP